MFGGLFARSSGGHDGAARDFDAAGAHRLIAAGAVVLDVRTAPEAAAGMVPGATLIPVQDLPRRLGEVERLVGGDKGRTVVVYCRSGGRSGSAKTILQRAGFTQVVNAGGYDSLR